MSRTPHTRAIQTPYLEDLTMYDQSLQICTPEVRLQCMFAPINLYVIAGSVTSSCVPVCPHPPVLLARYLLEYESTVTYWHGSSVVI